MEEFQDDIKFSLENYQGSFRALNNTITVAREFLYVDSQNKFDHEYQVIAVTMMLKMLNNLLALQLLVEKGFGIESCTLARSILEGYIDVFYLTNNSNKSASELAKRYIEYSNLERPTHFEIVFESEEIELPTKSTEFIDELRQFHLMYPDYKRNRFDWSGMKISEKATAAGVSVAEVYKKSYRILSGTSHGSAEILKRLVRYNKQRYEFTIGPTGLMIPLSISISCYCFLEVLKQLSILFSYNELVDKISAVRVLNEELFRSDPAK